MPEIEAGVICVFQAEPPRKGENYGTDENDLW